MSMPQVLMLGLSRHIRGAQQNLSSVGTALQIQQKIQGDGGKDPVRQGCAVGKLASLFTREAGGVGTVAPPKR